MTNSESAAFLFLSYPPRPLYPSSLINTWDVGGAFNEDRVDWTDPRPQCRHRRSAIVIESTLQKAPSQIPAKASFISLFCGWTAEMLMLVLLCVPNLDTFQMLSFFLWRICSEIADDSKPLPLIVSWITVLSLHTSFSCSLTCSWRQIIFKSLKKSDWTRADIKKEKY